MLTADRLRQLLDYDPDTGVFRWRVGKANVAAGSRAGCARPDGYRGIRIDGRRHHEHRLAFLHVTGAMPPEDVDHINGDPGDNRWINLRPASRSQNLANSRLRRDNKSGIRGVSWHAVAQKWLASISVSGRSKYLGVHDTKEAALAAYASAAADLHGEFLPSYARGRNLDPNAAGLPPGA